MSSQENPNSAAVGRSDSKALLAEGMLVRISGPMVGKPSGDFLWSETMDKYIGQQALITTKYSDTHFGLNIDNDVFGWDPEWLEPIDG